VRPTIEDIVSYYRKRARGVMELLVRRDAAGVERAPRPLSGSDTHTDLPFDYQEGLPPRRYSEIQCPKCRTFFTFRRPGHALFDSAGFESYEFECRDCRAVLVGLVDPFDGALLISESGLGVNWHPEG
jgi:hypothetical protein